MEIRADIVQNSIGQLCPMPIAFMAKNMKKLAVEQVLEIQADDEGAHADVPAWCEQTGNKFLGEEPAEGYSRYFVKKTVG
jgi:TusA-related sulfurtransferase